MKKESFIPHFAITLLAYGYVTAVVFQGSSPGQLPTVAVAGSKFKPRGAHAAARFSCPDQKKASSRYPTAPKTMTMTMPHRWAPRPDGSTMRVQQRRLTDELLQEHCHQTRPQPLVPPSHYPTPPSSGIIRPPSCCRMIQHLQQMQASRGELQAARRAAA